MRMYDYKGNGKLFSLIQGYRFIYPSIIHIMVNYLQISSILMLTTKSELENELKGFDLGVDDFMPKPFLPERLLARVRALLKRYYT
ncbi:hypothetical protein DRQ17_02285 [bacterium]|uniref:Response regulator transcription factor n=1 Tax=candidate division WOR-3 bacterium TaxID=2052148 RepID=A0A7C0VBB2_UNCW3|nr:MAG: hypothetical protein DRQ17_02285 [bacterium]HDI83576.1 response regulator transcription factor [candidate division WOR-3 bacterium]